MSANKWILITSCTFALLGCDDNESLLLPDEIQNVLTAVNDYYRTQEVGAGWKFSEVNYDARRNGAVDIYISIPKELNLTLSQWQAFCPNQYEVDFWSAVKGLEVYMYFVPLHSGEWGGTECPHPVL